MNHGSQVSVAHAILSILEAVGVDVMFGVPGGPLTGLFEAMRERNTIRLVIAKHESGAAFMAAAHARVTGALGVCVTTSGPGATNALTGVASAFCDSIPLLLLTGQVSTDVFGKGAIQESSVHGVDVVSVFRPVTKLSAMAPTAGRAADLLRTAVQTAQSLRPGPVHLSLPANMLRATVAAPDVASCPKRLAPLGVGDEQLDELVDLLRSSRRPCILAGHGVSVAGAHDELLGVAEVTSARILTSPKGKGTIAETHPLALGVLGFGGHDEAREYFTREADLVMVVGSSLNEFVTNAWTLTFAPSAKVAQIDIDPTNIGRNYRTDVAVVGDAKSVLRAIARRLSTEPTKAHGHQPSRVAARHQPSSQPQHDTTGTRASPDKPLKPRRLVEEMREAMPDDARLFVDNGNSILWSTRYFEVRAPHTYFIDLGLASMGSAVAGVVGGAMAAPSRRCVALVGDAAFAMHGFEVHTAVEERLDVIWVVLNDAGHGMVRHGDTLMHGAPLGVSDYRVPIDVAATADAMGARGRRADSHSQFRAVFGEALRERGPTVIDARIDSSETPPALIQRVQTLSRMLAAGRHVRSPLGG